MLLPNYILWKRDSETAKEARNSKSNPIELNFNRTQPNSICGLSSIEFGNRTKSNSHKKNNSIERSIFELLIFVKLVLKINNNLLEARVTSAYLGVSFD